MPEPVLHVKSISQIHEALGFPKPKHPLISLIDVAEFNLPKELVGTKIVNELYMISIKDGSCGMEYGRNDFDFSEGVMTFTGPRQASTATEEIKPGAVKGWMLFFHPDLIRGTHLGEAMDEYSFFNYEVYEALHLSEDEEKTVLKCVENIKEEYGQRIDNHSNRVIVSNLELLLNYSLRFYERQFNTRRIQSEGIVGRFSKVLKAYFDTNQHLEDGLPSIQYLADQVNLSAHYLSDVLKKETGRTAKDHINDFVIERAKDLLLGSDKAVSEIAWSLGFNYPHYFTRLFKAKTGKTPVQYRSSAN